jgi:hypothetical protein
MPGPVDHETISNDSAYNRCYIWMISLVAALGGRLFAYLDVFSTEARAQG